MNAGPWSALLVVRRPNLDSATRLHRALAPEAEREVPRAHCDLRLATPATVTLTISTRDTGALRAALNTYLGWIELADATERLGASGRGDGGASPEAVK